MAGSKYWEGRQAQRTNQRKFKETTMSLLEAFGWEISNQLKHTIEDGSRSGNHYSRGDKTHIASAPGEPPVTDYGQLVKSITAPQRVNDGFEVGLTSEYAMYLELGTKNMAPRPYVKRSVDKAWENISK